MKTYLEVSKAVAVDNVPRNLDRVVWIYRAEKAVPENSKPA
jgi:hypothetical protein